MTIIEINDNKIDIRGHSGYGAKGNDIVCSAISTLTEATYNYLIALDNDVNCDEDDGIFTMYLNVINCSGDKIIKSFTSMVDELEEQYPEFIRRKK